MVYFFNMEIRHNMGFFQIISACTMDFFGIICHHLYGIPDLEYPKISQVYENSASDHL